MRLRTRPSFAGDSTSGKLFPSNTTPTCPSVSASGVSFPSTLTVPASFFTRPSAAPISVLLPAPFSPISPTTVPRGTCRVTSSRWKRGYALHSPRTVNAISVIMVPPDKTV